MSINVFVPGRPGSGKSEAIRYISNQLRDVVLPEGEKIIIKRLKDYTILREMFMQDKYREKRQFRQTDYGGFDVCDFSVLNTALEKLDDEIQKEQRNADLLFIEFARQDYKEAFKLFKQTPLDTSYFLFVESDLQACIDRIYKRVHERQKPDHHFVSEYIMWTYYNKNNWSYMKDNFGKEFHISESHIKTINNSGLLQSFLEEVEKYTQFILHELQHQKILV